LVGYFIGRRPFERLNTIKRDLFCLPGSLAPTTPLVPVRKASRTVESRAVAGPSKPASKTGRGKAKNAKKAPEYVEVIEEVSSEHDELEDDEMAPPAPLGKSKGKEKARADLPAQPKVPRKAAQTKGPTTTDDIELIEDTEGEQPDPRAVKVSGRTKKTVAASTRPDHTTRELERLRQKLKDVCVIGPQTEYNSNVTLARWKHKGTHCRNGLKNSSAYEIRKPSSN
jgi:hypothetical protein